MDFTYIPNMQPSSAKTELTIDDIPEDVRRDVEEVYAELRKAPDGRMRTTFADKATLTRWFAQASAYGKLREPQLKVRKSPTKNLPENVLDFRVYDMPAKDEDAEAINTAVDVVKAAAAEPVAPAKATGRRTPRK